MLANVKSFIQIGPHAIAALLQIGQGYVAKKIIAEVSVPSYPVIYFIIFYQVK